MSAALQPIPRPALDPARPPWNGRLSDDQAAALVTYFEAYTAPLGAELCAEGDPAEFMGVLVSGLLRVSKQDFYDQERNIGYIEPGSLFGEMGFVDGQERSATVIVAEEATFLLIRRSGFDKLLTERPDLSTALLLALSEALSRRLREVNDRRVQRLY